MRLCTQIGFFLFFFVATAVALQPELVTNYSEARDFFSERNAKMLINIPDTGKSKGFEVYLMDFSKDPLTFVQLETANGHGFQKGVQDGEEPVLSPDGTRIAYRSAAGNEIVVRRAQKNGEDNGLGVFGYEPRWWVHPTTGEEYIIYVSTEGDGSSGIGGDTYIQKLNKGSLEPSGEAEHLIRGYALRAGRSGGGRFMFTAYPGWAIAAVRPEATEHAFDRFLVKGSRLCNASPYPGRKPYMLYLAPYHDRIYFDLWWPTRLKDLENVGETDYTEFSNHPDYITATWGDTTKCGRQCYDRNTAYIYHISERKWLRIARNTNSTSLWVEMAAERPLNPVFTVDNTEVSTDGWYAYSFQETKTLELWCESGHEIRYTFDIDTLPVSEWDIYTDPLTINKSRLVYAVATTANNGRRVNSDICKLMMTKSDSYEGLAFGSVTRSFPKNKQTPHDIRSFVKAMDGNNGSWYSPLEGHIEAVSEPEGTSVEVFVGVRLETPRVLDSVFLYIASAGARIQGSNATWNTGYEDLHTLTQNVDEEQTFTIESSKAYRYYRYLFPDPDNRSKLHELKFSFGDSASNYVVAPAILPSNGTFTDSLLITLQVDESDIDIVYTLDGTEPTASSKIYTDPFYITSSTLVKAVSRRDSHLSSPVSAVFTKVDEELPVPEIFPEEYVFGTQREITLTSSIEGADIHYTIDGGIPDINSTRYNAPFSLDRTSVVRARCYKEGYAPSPVAYRAFVTEVDNESGDGILHMPNGGEHYVPGDTLHIQWQTFDPEVFNVVTIELSTDMGISWKLLNRDRSIHLKDGEWGKFDWEVPNEIDGAALASSTCALRISQYNGPVIDISDGPFAINPSASVKFSKMLSKPERPVSLHKKNGGLQIRVHSESLERITLVACNGAVVDRISNPTAGRMSFRNLAYGVYHLCIVPREGNVIIRKVLFSPH